MEPETALASMIARRDARANAEGGDMFLGKPDRWYDDPTWRCVNGHVSKRFLKSEARGGDCCLACGEFVILTHPEDQETPA